MLLAILAVGAFQVYWLSKSYREEEQNLRIRTNILFRETVYQLQSEKLKLDTNIRIHVSAGPSATNLYRAIQHRVRDSAQIPAPVYRQKTTTAVVRKDCDSLKFMKVFTWKDSMIMERRELSAAAKKEDRQVIFYPAGRTRKQEYAATANAMRMKNGELFMDRPFSEGSIMHILKRVDSLQDSVTVPELSRRYEILLKKEKLATEFVVFRLNGPVTEPPEEVDLPSSNEVTLGITEPYTLRLELLNTMSFVIQKLSAQIIISVLLVGLTVLSFVLLLRNLIQQRKLTQLKNDLISNITHELKTPIATVSVAIEALKNFNALHDPQRTKEYLDISGSELQRLSLLVDKVLKLSMFEKHQIELKEETFDLEQLTREIVSSMRLQFEKYHAQVSVHLHGRDFMISADRLHITSVLFNLLDNALKYSKDHPLIRIDLTDHEGSMEISVSDNGIGIPVEYQKKIFDKFFRIPSGDTHNVKGYGLGLSYVAYVIKGHQGKIQVESEPGTGSRFIIKLSRTT